MIPGVRGATEKASASLGSPSRLAQNQARPMYTAISAASSIRGLTNVRDFPVPKRHRGVRIELRIRSFRKGKPHERSFYARNRLGKKYLLGPRAYGVAREARRARGATA